MPTEDIKERLIYEFFPAESIHRREEEDAYG